MVVAAFPFVLVVVAVAAADDVDAGAGALPKPIEPREAVVDAGTPDAAIPNLTLNAKTEPAVVPYGSRFDLVVTVTRDRGVHLELPGAIPDVENTPRVGEPMRSLEELAPPPPPPATAHATTSSPKAQARVRETIRIPFLALDTRGVKTPAFALTAENGATVDVASLDVKLELPPDKPPPNPTGPTGPTRLGPDAGPSSPSPPGTLVLEAHAPAIAYAVPDSRPYLIVGAFAAAGLLFAVVRYFQRRRKAHVPATPTAPPPPPRPAHETALERLEALLASGLLQRGETALFVERLMDEVLRDYITARFSLSAGTRTTRELVKDLLGVAVVGLDVALVEGLLADADLVKFAKASIAAGRAHAMATRVRALIDATKLVPATAATTTTTGGAR